MTARRGWCPDIHAPMLSGDGLLVRIKPYAGQLGAATAQAIAAAAAHCGNGVIELTSRANLQIRGLRGSSVAAFAAAMTACDAAEADPRVERARNIIVSPLAGSDPGVHPATHAVAAAILDRLRGHPDRAMPPKYSFVVDGGGSRPLHDVTGDVVVRLGPVASGARDVGYLGYAGAARGSVGLAPLFGQTDAAALHGLANLAARYGDAALRISPSRSFLIGGVPHSSATALARAADALGFITDPADARLRIAACPGRPACASGAMPARQDAAAWAGAISALAGAGRVHVSGCAKGCAHPGAADYTFVGVPDGYVALRYGRAADAPATRGRSLAACLDAMRAA